MNFLKRHFLEWVPARTTSFDTIMATYALIIMAVLRGWDYSADGPSLRDDDVYQKTVLPIENAMPLWMWAIGFLTVSVVLFAGKMAHLHRMVFVGHAIGAILYTGMMIGILTAIVPMWMWISLTAAVLSVAVLWFAFNNRRVAALPLVAWWIASMISLPYTETQLDGIRFGSVLILSTMVHWVFLLRMGWTPVTREARTKITDRLCGSADAD